jgi:uncharacterized membrane protein YfbV (UPF0208 family)
MALNLNVFHQHLIYETKASAETIHQDIEQIAILDREAELQVQKYDRYARYFGIGIFVFFILVFILLAIDIIPLASIAAIAFIISIAGISWTLIQRSKHKKFDLSNSRYEVLSDIIRMVSRDMSENEYISVRLVLSSPTHKNKLIQSVPHPYQSGFKLDTFADEWLRIKGFFADKSYFDLIATETRITKHGWKRNARGKSKHKSKTKLKGMNLHLTIHYPLKKYGAIQAIDRDINDAFKLPNNVTLKRLKRTAKNLTAIAYVPGDLAENRALIYQTVTMMFLSTYQVLNLARVLSKK